MRSRSEMYPHELRISALLFPSFLRISRFPLGTDREAFFLCERPTDLLLLQPKKVIERGGKKPHCICIRIISSGRRETHRIRIREERLMDERPRVVDALTRYREVRK